jgi:hypothetical protein
VRPAIHLSCLINKFGLSKNACTIQWLSDFLTAGNFQFVCNTCIEGKQSTSKKDAAQGFTAELTKLQASITAGMDKLHQEINDIRDSMLSASKPYDPSAAESVTG